MPLPAAAVLICRCFCCRPFPHSPTAVRPALCRRACLFEEWDLLTADECHGAAWGETAAVGAEIRFAAAGGTDAHGAAVGGWSRVVLPVVRRCAGPEFVPRTRLVHDRDDALAGGAAAAPHPMGVGRTRA